MFFPVCKHYMMYDLNLCLNLSENKLSFNSEQTHSVLTKKHIKKCLKK